MHTISTNILHLISPEHAWQYKIVPLKVDQDILTILITDNLNTSEKKDELEVIIGYQLVLISVDEEQILQHLSRHYRKNTTSKTILKNEIEEDFLNLIVTEARTLKSSDIHIEAYSNKRRIRFRIDGKLVERYRLKNDQYSSFINKIKIKSQLDIAEKRLPQDGRMRLLLNTAEVDIRVSILPSLYGEKVVLRILNSDSSNIDLETIGLDSKQLTTFKNVLKKPHGIILISGPTGSGKTTTLYATLKILNNDENNILTIEDPIEYTLDGVNQVQLRESIGLTFANALKTFLRQDPDIIMLGEIRDPETAQMAIRAALTGHLVLSTIHTNSAWSTISRLIDMGIPSFLLSSTMNLTAAQRLVRKLCPSCKSVQDFLPAEVSQVATLFDPETKFYKAEGCANCYYTGYAGRIAIYEIIPVDSEISLLIKDNVQDISKVFSERNIDSLKKRAINLVTNGITSVEEIYPILINY